MVLQPPIAKPAAFVPGQPPAGLIPAEAAILNTWLHAHYQDYDDIFLNVRVGHGIDPGDTVPDYVRANSVLNSQRRIDAVLRRLSAYTIVEVKVRGTLMASGQLLGYRLLWMRDRHGFPAPSLLLLCSQLDADTMYCLGALGILYEIVTPSATPETGAPR